MVNPRILHNWKIIRHLIMFSLRIWIGHNFYSECDWERVMSINIHSSHHNHLLGITFWSYPTEKTTAGIKVEPFWQGAFRWIISKWNKCSIIFRIIKLAIIKLEFKSLIFIKFSIRVPDIASFIWLIIFNFNG